MSLPTGTPAELFEQAQRWIDEHRAVAPRDYGAILPPELVDEGRAWQRTLFDAGWAGIHWPTEVGGRGLTVEHTAAWTRACALAQVPPWINMVGLVLTGGSILAYGTPEQQATHLPRILDATDVWCQLFSEPGAGSDLAGLATSAVRDGDEWVVNGQKVWTTLAHCARWALLIARTDPDVPKHKGLTYFVVDMQAPGVEVRPLRQMTGQAEFNEVYLTDVRIPDSHRLGAVGAGWQVAMTTLSNERTSIGASGGRGSGTIADAVSLWAQRLGTRQPVSEARLRKAVERA